MAKPTPPAIAGLPVLGNMLDFMRNRTGLLEQGYQQYGPLFSIKLGPKHVAVVAGEEAQHTFFTATDKALRMDKAYGPLRAMFGEIAFTASPETYNEQRHILHAPFKGGKMPGYVQVMQQEIQQWLDALGETGQIDLSRSLMPLVQNVAAHAIMGLDFRQRVGREFWDLYEDLHNGLDMALPPNLPLPKFRKRDQAKAKMHAMLNPIINEHRQAGDKYDDMLQDFATATYKDGRPVENEIIIGLITALMFAGHETTVGQAAWTVVELLRHPEYRKLTQADLDQYLPYGKPIRVETLAQLQHIEWAVHETTRMHPSASTIFRYAEEEVEIGDYRIPKGWLVMLNTELAQRLPEVFSNPNQFDPLRFAPDREEDKKHRFTITGFGGGVHKCTGMNFANNEMMVITSLLFQQFDLELLTPDPRPSTGLGFNSPEQALIAYRRKKNLEAISPEVMAQAIAAGCPHLTQLQVENPS